MARTNFLTEIRRARGDQYDGDQYGGAAGADGHGLPTGTPGNFLFATGIECSAPMIAGPDGRPLRRDLLVEAHHDTRFREDLALVHDLGLKVLRYGLPFHRMHLGPGRYDWSWADEAMGELKRLEITPILDLLHFGVPDWLGDFQNPELPAMEGKWNERRSDDTAFVTAVKHCVAADILATHAIARVRPDAIIVQSESAEFTHEARSEPSPAVRLQNKQRFIPLDLLYAHAPDADVCIYLMDNGLTRAEYDWFMKGEPPGYQVMGNDYYGRNETIVLPDGARIMAEDVMGWHLITKAYYERYKKPVMHTETNVFDPDEAPTWLWKQWVNVLRMRADGVPVLGFTWYSLTDQVDWDTGLRERNGRVNPCGLYDLARRPRPVAAAYRALLREFGRITIVPHAEMFTTTGEPAMLKTEV